MIEPFEYCTKCGLVYCHIQNFECVVCHGDLAPIEGLLIPGRNPTQDALDVAICNDCGRPYAKDGYCDHAPFCESQRQ